MKFRKRRLKFLANRRSQQKNANLFFQLAFSFIYLLRSRETSQMDFFNYIFLNSCSNKLD